MKNTKPPIMSDEELKDFALRLALHCVRNTVIEEYHAEGKLSQAEMKAFNKEVANKIYTLLIIIANPQYEEFRNSPEFSRLFYKQNDWDEPQLDKSFIKAIKIAVQQKSKG